MFARPAPNPTAFISIPIALALGSNLGPGRQTFDQACRELERAGIRILRRSRIYYTRPWGEHDQPPFVNAVLVVAAGASPRQLLQRCQAVERLLGRRRAQRWGPRRLDIDLLFHGAARMAAPELSLPHPWVARRDFVLAPLVDLGLSPPLGSGLPDFARALAAIPENQRSIICSERW